MGTALPATIVLIIVFCSIGCGEDSEHRHPSPCRLFELRIDMTTKDVRSIMGPPDEIETPEEVETVDGKRYDELLLSLRDNSYDDPPGRSMYRDDLDRGILSDGLRDSINNRSYFAFLHRFKYYDETPYLRNSQGMPIEEELISENARVFVQEAGQRWQVVDMLNDKTYEIRHASAFFSIYQVVDYDTLFCTATTHVRIPYAASATSAFR